MTLTVVLGQASAELRGLDTVDSYRYVAIHPSTH